MECACSTNRQNPYYILNSVILIVVISALGFLVAFAWNEAVKEAFEKMVCKRDELRAHFIYAVSVTLFAILLAFLLMFYLSGTTKW